MSPQPGIPLIAPPAKSSEIRSDPMDISCQFATSLRSPEHVAAAEALGHRRAWLYDTPAQSPDVWAMLALAAHQTERIALGPRLLFPTLPHPIINAFVATMLRALAPIRAP